jgi:hypothetical protein
MTSFLSVSDPVTGAHRMARQQALFFLKHADDENNFYKARLYVPHLKRIGAVRAFLQVFAPCLILLM